MAILYLPPYHCDLQPIEMVWSQVKGEFGRQYDIATTMQIVKQRLEAAFENLNADTMGENREPVHPCQKDRTRIHGADDNEEGDDREDDTASDSSDSDIEGDVEDQENADTSQSESSSSDDMSHESDTDDV